MRFPVGCSLAILMLLIGCSVSQEASGDRNRALATICQVRDEAYFSFEATGSKSKVVAVINGETYEAEVEDQVSACHAQSQFSVNVQTADGRLRMMGLKLVGGELQTSLKDAKLDYRPVGTVIARASGSSRTVLLEDTGRLIVFLPHAIPWSFDRVKNSGKITAADIKFVEWNDPVVPTVRIVYMIDGKLHAENIEI
ncbi:hypothetical protein QM565_30440 [Geitlerinema splendidum]|nr:hypothetical protein [Geitlerinema splendidum]